MLRGLRSRLRSPLKFFRRSSSRPACSFGNCVAGDPRVRHGVHTGGGHPCARCRHRRKSGRLGKQRAGHPWHPLRPDACAGIRLGPRSLYHRSPGHPCCGDRHPSRCGGRGPDPRDRYPPIRPFSSREFSPSALQAAQFRMGLPGQRHVQRRPGQTYAPDVATGHPAVPHTERRGDFNLAGILQASTGVEFAARR